MTALGALTMPAFLCARVENTPEASRAREKGARCATRQELSSLIASTIRVTTSSLGLTGSAFRVALFAHAASLAPGSGDDQDDAVVQRMLLGLYGNPIMMRRLMAMDNVVVMLSRENADAARVNTDPVTLVAYPPPEPQKEGNESDDDPWATDEEEAAPAPAPAPDSDDEADDGRGKPPKPPPKPPPPPPPVVSWGCVSEALELSELPSHLQRLAQAEAEQLCLSYDTLTHIDDPRGVDADELIEIVLAAWATLRRQQAAMLRERFGRFDSDADGVLSVPELWACLQSLLSAMVQSGGTAEAAAEPWLDRGKRSSSTTRSASRPSILASPARRTSSSSLGRPL